MLQYIVLATAWNILGGYCGYVNFGSAGFFALGAYTSIFLYTVGQQIDESCPISAGVMHAIFPLPVPVLIIVGGAVAGLVGLGMGYLTLRLRGVFFAIATLALAVVLETFIVNWAFVGGSRGAYVIPPETIPVFGPYIQYLFVLMLVLVIVALTTARLIERSRLGFGFATIRDDELAAEASGVPTLKLKLIATVVSGALMGMAGAPFPFYIGYVEPDSAFNLSYAVNSIAMPMIGGTTSWVGPMVGALLLGTLQQVATVTISSAANLLIVGLLLIGFVIVAPNGIVGLWQDWIAQEAEVMSAPLLQVDQVEQAFRRLRRARRRRSRGRRRRARRPDRPERLRQEHAGQLHLRHVAQRNRQRDLRRRDHRRPGRASAHAPRPRPQLPAAAAVHQPDRRRKYPRAAALYRERAAGPPSFGMRARRRAARNCSSWWRSTPRRRNIRATSPRSRCASSSSRAPWRPSRNC